MAFLSGIDELRSINWGRKHDWELRFPDAPAPFKTWFPAADIEESLSSHEPETIQIANTSFNIPSKRNALNLKITFYDDENSTLASWIAEWMDSMTSVNGVQGVVTPVKDAVRQVVVQKLKMTGTVVSAVTYLVFPVGEIAYNGANDNGVQTYSQSFAIVARGSNQVS